MRIWHLALLLFLTSAAAQEACQVRGTGDLAVIVERASGSVRIVDTTQRAELFRVSGLGDLSHASLVFSRDARYAYVFGRDGGLTKLDVLCGRLVRRVVQSGNAIGGAISQDGRWVAVSNYEPGGVRVFDAETLEQVADLPADLGEGPSKVVGLVDAPGQRLVYSLFEAGEIRIADLSDPKNPTMQRFRGAGSQPYDALVTPDGRHYVAGLFGQDGLAVLDLWHPEQGVRRVLEQYGKGQERLPVYKMPHLEGVAFAGDRIFLPAVGHHEVVAVSRGDWREVGRVPVAGQPVFVQGRPDGRELWVNFALPDNGKVQIIDTESLHVVQTLTPGPGVMHLEFSPRGETVWLSVRDADEVQVYDSATRRLLAKLPAQKPSGIFFTARAHRIGF